MPLPKELTSIPTRNHLHLIGRVDFMDKLRTNLEEFKEIVLVNAMGGVGKTAIAEAYVGKYYDDYAHLAWIQQGEQDDFRLSFTTNGQLLSSLEINAEGKDIEGIFAEICTKLNNIEAKPKLLVIDNMTQAVIPYLRQLPKQPNWHVLYTSRESLEREQAWRMDLDFLSDEDAINLYQYYYDGSIDRDAILELVSRFGKHTLTIEILAKAQRKNRYSLAELQEALQLDLEIGATTSHSLDERVETIKSYLSRIFDMSKLEEQEIWLLKQFACLPTTAHGFTDLFDLLESEELERSTLSKLCTNLHEKGWLLYNNKEESYRMHAVIQELIPEKHPISQDDVAQLLNSISGILYIDESKDNPIDKFGLIPFGQSLLNQLFGDTPEKAELQTDIALILRVLGNYEEAKNLLEESVRIYERQPGEDPQDSLRSYASLGLILRSLGKFGEAKHWQEKVRILCEKIYGTDHPSTAVSYSNLALVLKDLGDYSGAKTLLEKAVRSDEENFGESHPSTAVGYSNLATVLQILGDNNGAKILLEKAVGSDEENFGESHPSTARNYSNLATVLQNLGDYSGAKTLLEKAVRSDEENFGESHPNTARSYSNLATVLQDLGDYSGAKELLEKALRSDEQNFGEDHPTTAVRYSNLALVLQALGDYSGAKELLEKALGSAEQNFGEDHPTTAVRYSNLATVLQDLGDYSGAKDLLEKAVGSDEKNFGESHPSTARSYTNLAAALQALGDYSGAKALFEKAMRSNQQHFGQEHPKTAICYWNLAALFYKIKEQASAYEYIQLAHNAYVSTLPEGHPTLDNVKVWLGAIKEAYENENKT